MKSATETITIISSFTEDILINNKNEVIETHSAGPAFFISNALKDDDTPFQLITGNPMTVEILVTPEGEFGRIPEKPITRPIIENISEWTVLSTVLKEWDPESIRKWPERLFVDLQGFVRNGNDFGKKQTWEKIASFKENVFCLKGTAEEVKYIPEEVLESQKKRLLLITHGDKGVDVFFNGQRTFIPTKKISGLKNTIGAGDTFLAYFVSCIYKGERPVAAAEYACKKTVVFLKTKLIK